MDVAKLVRTRIVTRLGKSYDILFNILRLLPLTISPITFILSVVMTLSIGLGSFCPQSQLSVTLTANSDKQITFSQQKEVYIKLVLIKYYCLAPRESCSFLSSLAIKAIYSATVCNWLQIKHIN